MTTLYEPRDMLAAMREQVKPDSFLTDRLVNHPTSLSDTKYIEIDDEVLAQDIAVYNTRTGEPVEVSKDNFSTKIHVAPYVDEVVTITVKDTDTRIPGETVYEGSKASRRGRQIDSAMRKLGLRLDRLNEAQIAEIIQEGTVTVLNAATGVSYTIDFGLPAGQQVTLATTAVWGGSASDILGNLQSWSGTLEENGYVVTDAYMHQDAGNLLLADATILSYLDNRSVDIGEIKIDKVAGQRASYLGALAYPGLNIRMWTYNGGYRSDATTFNKYLDQYRCVLVGSGFGIQPHYGKIENHKISTPTERFPNMWDDGGRGKKEYVGMESSPCMVARNIRGIFSAIVKS